MSKVTLQSPENAQTGVATTGPLIWNAVEGWDKYRVEVALRDPLLIVGDEFAANGALIDRIISETSLTIDPPLSGETEYVWRVRAARVEVVEPDPAVLGVTVSPSTLQIEQGSTENVTASVEVEGDASQDVTWQSSDTNVATVESIGSTSAAVTGVAAGSATITATSVFDETKTGTAALTVTEQSSVTDSRAGDEAALTDLRESTNFDNWFIKTGWDGTISLANTMTGVTVETINGELRVVELDMQKQTFDQYNVTAGNNLVGTLPASIGNLRWCRKLNLKQNKFIGTIPSEIGNMVSLVRLSLAGQGCELDLDKVSEWYEGKHSRCLDGGFPNKRHEDSNEFTGHIPTTIGNLVDLELLEIRHQFLTGTLPAEIGQCTKLKGIFLNDQRGPLGTALGGNLPNGWGGLTKLRWLNLSSYEVEPNYTGTVPSDWESWTDIVNISLSRNNLTGDLPTFPNANDMRYVNYGRNNFTGPFPISYFDGTNAMLNKLELALNNLTGEIPQETPPAPTLPIEQDDYNRLSDVGLTGNSFTGSIPVWFGMFRRIQIASWDSAGFTSIPDGLFTTWRQLRNVKVKGNNFNQTLPSSFGSQTTTGSTQRLEFNNAGFTGQIPSNWENYRSNGVRWLYLNDNSLSGPIPAGIADWRSHTSYNVSVDTGNNRINHSGNNFSNGKILYFEGSNLPGGISPDTKYYVRNRTTSNYQLSTTPDGTIINITSAGSSVSVRYNAWVPGYDGLRIQGNNFTEGDKAALLAAWPPNITIQH